MNSVNNSIRSLKEQQIKVTEEKKKQLEKKFNEVLFILIGLLTTLSRNSNTLSKYKQFRIIKDIERELVKHRKILVDYQKEFLYETLRNNFNENYNELYMILKTFYGNDIKKSTIIEDVINKIISSKFFDKTLDKRIVDNTTLTFNKINKELSNKLVSDNENTNITTVIIGALNTNFDSLTKTQKRLLDTEDTRLFNEAQKKVFRDFGIENLIWCSVLCENTCSECANNDGQPFSIEDIDMIPLHSRCNCYWEIV